ncbi:neurogenic locus Notch protein-like [Sycon ciliatum]|uniref:neurogenic locus Notch protein-like n=1 Tax=Sycon ciliatum TaxID=27933 RepID=UPI0031F70B82
MIAPTPAPISQVCKCLNQGQCDDKGKCICLKGFTGDNCQKVVCTHPWVKKNKVCECKPRLNGPNCTVACNCLNNGQCTEDGTCVCPTGFRGDQCQDNFRTKCLGTDKVMYTWTALAGLPCYSGRCPKITSWRKARDACSDRGYQLVDFKTFTLLGSKLGVSGCVKSLLHEMMVNSNSSPITIWTSSEYNRRHIIYKQDKNKSGGAIFSVHGFGRHNVICEAQWLHANDSVYAAATPALGPSVTEQCAENACQQYGLRLITKDWLQEHGHVLRERWLERLALDKSDGLGYHVAPILVNGQSLYRTVKFSRQHVTFKNKTSHEDAKILCVKSCGSGVLAPSMSCVCNRTMSYGEECEKACKCLNQGECDNKGECSCPRGFTGHHCQLVVCEEPWVKKSKVCECQPGLDRPNCTEACNCLNDGQCTDDGSCNCRNGFHGDKCQHTFKTKCLGTDNATYTWMALASLPCHPHLDGDSCQKKTNLTHARQMCTRRGYNVVDHDSFTNQTLGVRDCMEALLNEMVTSSYSNPTSIWTSFVKDDQHLIYQQGKNSLTKELYDSDGTSHHDVICEAKWLHYNDSVYAAATPSLKPNVTEQFAEEACQEYGLHLITYDWLQAHGHVLRERWLDRLALRHAPYHVTPIRVNGNSHYITVTFRNRSNPFQNSTINRHAKILCVKHCANGVLAQDLSCKCNRTVFYGDYCEKDGCKCLNQGQCDNEGKCICPTRFYGEHCQLECRTCLNQGRCNEDGTCTCAEGWIGDRCQTGCADTDPCCVNKRIVTRRDQVCRAATSDCDVAEYCDGENATCPQDLTARNGWPCSNSQASCWSGVCQSRTGQCQSVWNDMDQGSAPEDCFAIMNVFGERTGNCGFKSSNSTPGTYAACAAGDALCGSLFCLPLARKNQPSSDVLSKTVPVRGDGGIIRCNGLYASPPRSHDDPSLVKDGTRCDASGANKDLVCHKQRCVDQSRVTSQCSVDADSGKECGGVGVCTNVTTCLYPPTPESNESANTTQAATPTTSYSITKQKSDPATTTPTEVV